jgi:hypothetical protein
MRESKMTEPNNYWRPADWHTKPIKQNPLHCLAPQECADSFFEAGASAMLEARDKDWIAWIEWHLDKPSGVYEISIDDLQCRKKEINP